MTSVSAIVRIMLSRERQKGLLTNTNLTGRYALAAKNALRNVPADLLIWFDSNRMSFRAL